MASWFLYLVECRDGTLYAGVSPDVERRVAAHNAGRGARYTRARRPVRLVFLEEHTDRSSALRAEVALKRQPRALKELLARSCDAARESASTEDGGSHGASELERDGHRRVE